MSPARRYLQQRTRRRAQRCGSPLTGLLASLTRSRKGQTRLSVRTGGALGRLVGGHHLDPAVTRAPADSDRLRAPGVLLYS